ncbi:MAG: cob(I)yrinic acid a,c-diamide adenosyltransferase [Myxococcota bacterium]|jgi:cob(I)alamin adenosyltransferase|nr:cob(I)yrinic acid a,c-diamide adenosyltransferase [Myxococcota bacterium]
MRITKVYTRAGDKGTTRLVGGLQVSKSHTRIRAYGTVDELNAMIGVVRALLENSSRVPESGTGTLPALETLSTQLHEVQNALFEVGSDLATPADSRWEGMHRVGDEEVQQLESRIDELNEDLQPLEEFILPGGGMIGAHFHLARTVCRRAERDVVELMGEDPEVGEGSVRFLNRLSDYFFVAGRWAALQLEEPEVLWSRR